MCANFKLKQTTLTSWPKFTQKWILGSEFQKFQSGFGISILEILCAPKISIVKMPCVPIFRKKGTTLTFSTQICPKMDFGVEISKIYVRIRNLHFQDTMCVNFQLKRTTLTFFAQICPKMDFEVKILKI